MNKNVLWFIVFAIVIGSGSYTLWEISNPYNCSKFIAQKWGDGDIDIRTGMVDSLIQSKILIGKSKKEILTLHSECGQTYKPTYIPNTYSYLIWGDWFNWISFDSAYLLIQFFDKDIAIDVSVSGT